jgi:hexokinase
MVTDLAQGAGREILRGLEGAEAQAAQLQVLARAIIARSALHAAMVLAAVTHRTGFGKGAGGFPDLLGMEGSVWKTLGYQELVKSSWQDLVGGDRLMVDLAAEPSYNASLSGPLYLAAIHHPKDGTR